MRDVSSRDKCPKRVLLVRPLGRVPQTTHVIGYKRSSLPRRLKKYFLARMFNLIEDLLLSSLATYNGVPQIGQIIGYERSSQPRRLRDISQ